MCNCLIRPVIELSTIKTTPLLNIRVLCIIIQIMYDLTINAYFMYKTIVWKNIFW